MTPPLETVLADWHEKATALRAMKAHVTPETLEQALTDIAAAAERFLRWLNDTDAQLYSGRSLRWLRGEYQRLEDQQDAKRIHGKRYYRMAALPVALNADRVIGDAQRDALEDVA